VSSGKELDIDGQLLARCSIVDEFTDNWEVFNLEDDSVRPLTLRISAVLKKDGSP
jgi:hypothetical protein